jgi:HlyD family secretion protein
MKVLERTVSAPVNGQPLGASQPRSRRRLLLIGIAAVLAVIVGLIIVRVNAGKNVSYISTPVVRKDLVQTVTATGTVNPQNTILVGSQVSGTITELDADFNSVVRRGQILARIDPTSFNAQLNSAQASESESRNQWSASVANAASAAQNVDVAVKNVAVARAALRSAQSQVAKAQATLSLANLTVSRDSKLLAQGFISQSQADADIAAAVAAKAAYDAAVIAVNQSDAQLQAQLSIARASSSQAQSAGASAVANQSAIGVQHAAVTTARYNFNNTIIRSPVNGMVIARNVSIGQTVAASFQTPTLFTIAQDLTKMEVDVAAGEPDIGGVRAGNYVDFTVLAYPNRTFHGVVYQVRQNPTTINNVVTYDTVVYVENKDGALYPGMTANASIHVAKVMNALVVPIAALQWAPAEKQSGSTPSAGVAGSPWGMTEASLTRTIVAGRNGRVYVLRGRQLARIPVRVVLVSGTEAAVVPISSVLHVGDTVVTADTASLMAEQQRAGTSAFATPGQTLGRPSAGGR